MVGWWWLVFSPVRKQNKKRPAQQNGTKNKARSRIKTKIKHKNTTV